MLRNASAIIGFRFTSGNFPQGFGSSSAAVNKRDQHRYFNDREAPKIHGGRSSLMRTASGHRHQQRMRI